MIFLITLVILGAISAVFLYNVYQTSADQSKQQMILDENLMTALHHDLIKTSFNDSAKLAIFISKTPAVNRYIVDPSDENRRDLARALLDFSYLKPYMDQFRVLDAKGNELIRVNHLNGKHVIIADKDLQYKGDRYYVKELNAIGRGEIYISQLDLNIENGQIEVPYKPTIRIGVPLFSIYGNRFGSILINIDINRMFESFIFDESTDKILGFIQIIEDDGHYIFNEENLNSAFGEILPDRAQFNLSTEVPEVWAQIAVSEEGYTFTDNGLYSYRTIDLTSLDFSQGDSTPEKVITTEPVYYLVLHLSNAKIEILQKNINTLRFQMIIGLLILTPFFAYGVAILTSFLRENTKYYAFHAQHDPLTGLGNRKHLDLVFGNLDNNGKGFIGSIFFFDLDGFKSINDNFGHNAGDHVLKQVGKNVSSILRKNDVVVRIGGDEFMIITSDALEQQEAISFGNRIIETVRLPYKWQDAELKVSASVGVFINSSGKLTLEEAITKADQAMYQGKIAGKSQVVIFGTDQEMPDPEIG